MSFTIRRSHETVLPDGIIHLATGDVEARLERPAWGRLVDVTRHSNVAFLKSRSGWRESCFGRLALTVFLRKLRPGTSKLDCKGQPWVV